MSGRAGRIGPGQYGLSTLLSAGLLVGAWLAVLNPWHGVPLLLPAVVAATCAAWGTGVRGVRWACFAVAVCGCLLCLAVAIGNAPLIVPADSDLGRGARLVFRDWFFLFLIWAGAAAAIGVSQIVPWFGARLALWAGLLAVSVGFSFASAQTPHETRWALVTLAAVLLAAEGLPAFGARALRWFPFGPSGWILLFASLVVAADWQGRLYLGLVPGAVCPWSGAESLPQGSSASVMDRDAGRANVSTAAGLRAVVGIGDGLVVETLDGRRVFRAPASGSGHCPDLVLFSPDGRTLAVTEKHPSGTAGRITLWDVRPGDGRATPIVTRRHTVGAAQEVYFALSFFPDGRTLVASNGDDAVRLWDVHSGRELACFVAHARSESWDLVADCVAASPDGRTFATWAVDGIRLWDKDTLEFLRKMNAREAVPLSLAFTPKGDALVGVGRCDDGERVFRWKVHASLLPLVALAAVSAATLGCVLGVARRYA